MKKWPMKKTGLLIGIAMIISAWMVRWMAMDWWSMRIPEDWYFKADYLGNNAFADANGQLPKKRDINKYTRERTILEWSPNRTLIEEHYTLYDITTGKVTYEFVPQFEVDPKTGKHLRYPDHPETSGIYYLFPRGTTKQDYRIFDYTLNVVPMQFFKETIVNDINLYVFQYKGMIDYTSSYAGSDNFPGMIPPAGQRIITSNMLLQYWVEPITGNIVKIVEDSPGDCFVDEKTGKQIATIAVWSGQTTNENTRHLIQKTREKLQTRNLVFWWIPGGLLIFGFILLGYGYRKRQITL